MNALLVIAAAALAAEPQAQTGWEKLPSGGYRYIIQILPEDAQEVINNYDIECEPPVKLDVRQVKVTVGRATLPQEAIEEGITIRSPISKGPAREPDDGADSKPARAASERSNSIWERSTQFDPPAKEPKPLPSAKGAQPAGFTENSPKYQVGRPALGAADTTTTTAAKPWTPLVATGIALLCSLGANFYLGWIAAEARRRYRNLLERMHETVST